MMENTLSAADVAAVTRNNDGYGNNGLFGNDWAWIVILLLFGWGGRGFGGGFGGFGGGYGESCGTPATQADLAAGFNNSAVLSSLNDIKLGQAGINQNLMSGFSGVDSAICTLGYQNQQGFNSVSREIADCCCTTQRLLERGFADTNYNLATQACDTRNTIQNGIRDVIDNQNQNSRAILDFLTQDKISTLTAENQNLKFAASQAQQNAFITANQEAQTAELIRRLGRDCPIPAYVVPNPNCCYQGCGNSFGSF